MIRDASHRLSAFPILLISGLISACGVTSLEGISIDPDFQPPARLISIQDFNFQGAFALPPAVYGESSANWAEGVLEVNGSSMFFVGHDHDDAIAEFIVPELTSSTSIEDLRYADPPKQAFGKVLGRSTAGNPENLDQIVGLEVYKGSLVGNGVEYYDAPADNLQSTFVVNDASAIRESTVTGFFSIRGGAKAAGWLSQVPLDWQRGIGCTHIAGHSSGGSIISRHSVGPSAYCINLDHLISAESIKTVKTGQLLGYAIDFPLQRDLFNESRDNKIWTHLSQARFGFIVPGTSTYVTIGTSGGHQQGVGYKLEIEGRERCAGYCSVDPADNYNYYWLWDMRDLLKVRQGRKAANAVLPYEFGEFKVPFQTGSELNKIGGASYDSQSGLLYISILKANNTLGPYSNPPVIASYSIK